MKLSYLHKFVLFLSSYSLLFISLAIKYNFAYFTYVLIILIIIGSIGTYWITKMRINPDKRKLVKIISKNDQVLSYLVSYLLPLIGFDLTNSNEFLAMLMILIGIGVLYIKADLIYINPLLMIFGFNIFEVHFSDGATRMLISRKSIHELRLFESISFYELEDRSIIIERIEGSID